MRTVSEEDVEILGADDFDVLYGGWSPDAGALGGRRTPPSRPPRLIAPKDDMYVVFAFNHAIVPTYYPVKRGQDAMDALPDSYLLMAAGSDYTGYPMPVSQAHAALLAMGDEEQAEDILIFATDPESVMLDMREAKERIARTVRSEFEIPDLGEFHDYPKALRRIAESYWMEAPRQNSRRGKRYGKRRP